MPVKSAGIILHRRRRTPQGSVLLEVLLAHSGGPLWADRDEGAWTIPKGIVENGEDFSAAARREFFEETGLAVTAPLEKLGEFPQPSGKIVIAFASRGDFDPAKLTSNSFLLEWPPHSGKQQSFPEIDRAEWFSLERAAEKLRPGQRPILAALLKTLRQETLDQAEALE